MKRLLLIAALAVGPVFGQTTYKLSGTVTSGGKPVPNVLIDVRTTGGPAPNFVATTDADGAFQVALNPGTITIFAVPPPATGFVVAGVFNLNLSADTFVRIVVGPAVTLDVTGRSTVSFPERLAVYSLTTSRNYFMSTVDGHAVFTVPPDVYSVHAAHGDTSYYFGRTTVDVRDG